MEYPPVCADDFSLSRRRLLAAGASFAAAFAAGLSLRANGADADARVIAGWDASLKALAPALMDTIIPATDTPGALSVGAPAFLELVLRDLLTPADRAAFTSGLHGLDLALQQQAGASFTTLPAVRRTNELARFDGETYAAVADGATATAAQASYLQLKEYTLIAFFTSQNIATTMLDYTPVPGPYMADMALAGQPHTFYEDGGAVGAHLNAGKIL